VPAAVRLEKVHAALAFALRRHEGHRRRDGVTPYAVHPLRILVTLALRVGVRDEASLCAALLHDTLEDTRTDYDELRARFGRRIADLVAVLSKDVRLPEPVRERAYLRQLVAAPLEARVVKLADLFDNLADSGAASLAERRRAARRKRALVEALVPTMPARHAAFGREVDALLRRCLGLGVRGRRPAPRARRAAPAGARSAPRSPSSGPRGRGRAASRRRRRGASRG
jgi:guanosine-3',5'-bis(diphosphate) 3'-pyrophosphohydrolase